MRILAIRGKNIASLAGAFGIDFRNEPLASAGLFAICGPTGSGKSTLLDAMCLALYDTVPRLQRAAKAGVNLPDVGEDTITQHDPRGLLRRGSVEGVAEVEFTGNDGGDYRARWSVRRAHARPGGRLRPAEMTLVRLSDNQPIATQKTEALGRIETLVGLDFAQFNRAVLLAQNEFTAFLQADDNVRAMLLEQLTGTDIYTSLSELAYARAADEQKALAALQARADEQQPLDAAARSALELKVAEARAAAEALETETRTLDEYLRWYDELERARSLEDIARQQQQEAARRRDDAAGRRALLARVEAVQPAAGRLADCDRTADEARASREQAVPRAEEGLAHADAAVVGAEKAVQKTRDDLQQAEENQRAAAPRLRLAADLDLELGGLERQRTAADEERSGLAVLDDRAQRAASARRAERDAAQADMGRASEWLAQHADRRRLADEWARWDTLLRQAAAAEADAAAGRKRAAEAERAASGAEQALEEAARKRRDSEDAVGRAEHDFAEAGAALASFDTASIAASRSGATTRREGLDRAQRLDSSLHELDERATALRQAADAAAGKVESAARELAAVETRKPLAEAARRQAEKAHDEARQACAKNVEKLRQALEPGRPCPVCGATDHPYAVPGTGFDNAALRTLRRQLDECQQEVEALSARAAEQAAVKAGAEKRGEEIAHELATIAGARAAADDKWLAVPPLEPGDPIADTCPPALPSRSPWFPDPARSARFTAQLDAITERLQALDVEEQRAHAASANRERVRLALEEARKAHQEAVRLDGQANARALETKGEAAAARDRLERAEGQRDDLLRQLDGAFAAGDWLLAWRAGPETFREGREADVGEYRSWQESLRTSSDCLGRLDVEVAGLEKEAARTAAELDRAREGLQNLDREIAGKREGRMALFDGRPVAEVEEDIQARIRSSRRVADAAMAALSVARAGHSAAAARLDEARRVLLQREQAAAASLVRLEDWLAAFNPDHAVEPPLDQAALRELLAHDAAWIAGERQDLQVLDTAFEAARCARGQRQADREALESRRPTAESADALRPRQAEVAAALRLATTGQIETEAALRNDDERRRKGEALRSEIDRQQSVAALWARMNELIGSADGKRFRNYAQQLTLDVLLEFANRHLADLARRYSLKRLENKLALTVIDRDMAGEVRSVYSLSGGESFLVSLALALGLASLSANRVRVESLFIDEGFGALDADTLAIAMDALDRVHAQGRKVGVISHVQEMAERIGTQVRVERLSGGRSRIVVAG